MTNNLHQADISWSTKARTSLDNVVNNSFAMRLKTIYAEPTIIYEIKEETYGIVLAAQTTYPASEDWWCNIRDPVLYEPLKELAKHGINGVMEGEYKYRYLYFRFLKCLARLPPMLSHTDRFQTIRVWRKHNANKGMMYWISRGLTSRHTTPRVCS
jgi:hypothetical protein